MDKVSSNASARTESFMSIIKRVALHSKVPEKSLELEVYGKLANTLSACEGAQKQKMPRAFLHRDASEWLQGGAISPTQTF